MNRRAFLSSLLIAPTALKRLAKPDAWNFTTRRIKLCAVTFRGLHRAQFKYSYIDQPAHYDEMIFHQRDYYGKWNYETT